MGKDIDERGGREKGEADEKEEQDYKEEENWRKKTGDRGDQQEFYPSGRTAYSL